MIQFHSRQYTPRRGLTVSFADEPAGDELRTGQLSSIQHYLLYGIFLRFATSSTILTRTIRIGVQLASNTNHRIWLSSAADQDQDVSTVYSWAVGASVEDTLRLRPLPHNIIIQPGWELFTGTLNIQGGDQFTNIFAFVEPL